MCEVPSTPPATQMEPRFPGIGKHSKDIFNDSINSWAEASAGTIDFPLLLARCRAAKSRAALQ